MYNDLVSIIVPIYNVASYLDRCIQSACNQTYTNIELILVDDGSTDGSGYICDKWAETDERIVVIHQNNRGVSAARNKGLERANGVYISFLDADDELMSHALEVAINKFDDGVDLVSFSYVEISPSGKKESLFTTKNYINDTTDKKYNFIIGPFFSFDLGWNVWNSIFLRSLIIKYSIRFPENISFAEDQLFCLLYYSHCNCIYVIDDILYLYYKRKDSLTDEVKRNHKYYFGEKNQLAIIAYQHYKEKENNNRFVSDFSVIHYLIIERLIQDEEKFMGFRLNQLRQIVIDDIKEKSDIIFYFEDLKQFLQRKELLKQEYDMLHILEKISRAKWLLTSHSFWYTVLVKWRKGLESIFKKNTNT